MVILFLSQQKKIMFRLLFLSLVVFNCCSLLGQATTVLNEDFEGSFPVGWTTINNDGLSPDTSVGFINDAWVITPDLDDTTSGDSVITSTSWYSPAGTSDDWLITPAITLGSFGNKLSFKAKSYDGSYPDGFQVFASTHNVIDSLLQQDTLLDISAQAPNWTRYYVSLDSFGLSDQTIYLAFRNNSADQYLLSLDSIYVGIEHPVNISEIANRVNSKIFPNPSTNYIEVFTDEFINRIEIYSIEGKLINTCRTNVVNISQIPIGQYIMRIETDQGRATHRFEKN